MRIWFIILLMTLMNWRDFDLPALTSPGEFDSLRNSTGNGLKENFSGMDKKSR